jgi:hypothetical protein
VALRKKVDRIEVAEAFASDALSAFDDAVTGLEIANGILTEERDEADAAADAATFRAVKAERAIDANNRVIEKIRGLLA